MIREHAKLPLPKIYEYRVLMVSYTDLAQDTLEMQKQGWVILEETFLIMDSNVKFVIKKRK